MADLALRTYGTIPTRVDRCCYVLYSIQSRERAREHWGQRAVAQQNDTKDTFTKSREQSRVEGAFDNEWIPQLEVQLREIRGKNHQSICGWYLWNKWKRNGTTSFDETMKNFPS